MFQKNKNIKSKSKDYERLGRYLESIFESGYANHSRAYRISFLRGILFGLGVAIGGSFVVACILWILSLFTELPLVGNLVETIKESIHTN